MLLGRIGGGVSLPDHPQIFHAVICRTVEELIFAEGTVGAGEGSALAICGIYTRLSCAGSIVTSVDLVGP